MDELVKFLEELADRPPSHTADRIHFFEKDRRKLRGVALILKGKRNVAVGAALEFVLSELDDLDETDLCHEIATYLEGGD